MTWMRDVSVASPPIPLVRSRTQVSLDQLLWATVCLAGLLTAVVTSQTRRNAPEPQQQSSTTTWQQAATFSVQNPRPSRSRISRRSR